MALGQGFLDLLESRSRRILPVMECGFPGETWRVAKQPFSPSTGHYRDGVVSFGSIKYAVSERGGSLPNVTATVRWNDSSGDFSRLVGGPNRRRVRGSSMVIRLGTPDLIPSLWPTRFNGILDDWSQPSPKVYDWKLRYNDAPLRSQIPKTTILQQDWRNGLKDVFGLRAPLVLGVHDSTGSVQQGMIPCIYVDTVNFVYLVSLGWLYSVDRVFVDGVLVPEDEYTITRPLINGRRFTCIQFDETQDEGEEVGQVKVTCDVHGIESTGTGAGAMVEEPSAQLAIIIREFGFRDYQSGAFAGTLHIDEAAFAVTAAYSALKDFKGSCRYGGDNEGASLDSVIANYCQSFGWRSYWTGDGTIAVKPTTHIYPAGPRTWLSFNRDALGAGAFDPDNSNFLTRVKAQSVRESVGRKYLASLDVLNPRFSVSEEVAQALEMPCSQATLSAEGASAPSTVAVASLSVTLGDVTSTEREASAILYLGDVTSAENVGTLSQTLGAVQSREIIASMVQTLGHVTCNIQGTVG